jgi:2,3,4,5-tetrahydropyridine-2-carboxylate N-succinyltransferase
METWESESFEYHDKMLLKRGYAEKGFALFQTLLRYGAYISMV